ncbi:MAG: M20/M25/M40 family metallo-hydrolase [Gemmatimonadota bacterium]|jgi:Zn-dependent M28 family amino/carboxypeptidase
MIRQLPRPATVLFLAVALAHPLAAQVAAPAAATVDSASLMTDLRVLAADSMEGRRSGTAGAERARRYIEARLRALGVEPLGSEGYRQAFPLPGGRVSARPDGINLVGRIAGTDTSRAIVVTAHYDHLGVRNGQVYNGADDNASGVAAMLAVARALRRESPQHTILLVALDAEESGLLGARAFVADPPVPREAMAIDLNFDMVSRNAAGELWVAGTYEYPFLKPFVEALAKRAPVILRPGHDRPDGAPGEDWTDQSDQGAFHDAGIPFLYFGVEDHPDYHRPTDDWERIEPGFFVAATATLVDAVRSLDGELDRLMPRRH